jgi:hypothetical protein
MSPVSSQSPRLAPSARVLACLFLAPHPPCPLPPLAWLARASFENAVAGNKAGGVPDIYKHTTSLADGVSSL